MPNLQGRQKRISKIGTFKGVHRFACRVTYSSTRMSLEIVEKFQADADGLIRTILVRTETKE